MKKLFVKILFICSLSIGLYAYELPTIDLTQDSKAEIILFSAESVLIDKKLSYILRWKTVNSQQVQITYLGDIALSGDMTITEEEYKMGPITLKAFNTKNGSSDSKTINEYVHSDKGAPIIKREEREANYDNMNIGRPYYGRRWNPRNIH